MEILSRRSFQGEITTFPFLMYRLLINVAKQRKIRFGSSQGMVFTLIYALDLTLKIKKLFSGPPSSSQTTPEGHNFKTFCANYVL